MASLHELQTDIDMRGEQYSRVDSILSIRVSLRSTCHIGDDRVTGSRQMLCGLWPASDLTARLPTAKVLCTCSLIWSGWILCYVECFP